MRHYSHSVFNEQVEFSGNSAGHGGGGMAVSVYSISTYNGKKLCSLATVLMVMVEE